MCRVETLADLGSSAIGSIINRLAYGEEIFAEHGQNIMQANREAMDLLNYTFTQFWFVDVFAPRNALFIFDPPAKWISHSLLSSPLLPPVKYIPAWFPGATFQRIAKRSSELSDYIRNKPWKFVLERVRAHFGPPLPVHPSLLTAQPMQMARPEAYEDCMATRGIEKNGSSDTLRDAVAIMYSGTYATRPVLNNESSRLPLQM
jgi:hypothetical protein